MSVKFSTYRLYFFFPLNDSLFFLQSKHDIMKVLSNVKVIQNVNHTLVFHFYLFTYDFIKLFFFNFTKLTKLQFEKKYSPCPSWLPRRSLNVLSKIIISSILYQFCLPQTSRCNSTPSFSSRGIFRTFEGL